LIDFDKLDKKTIFGYAAFVVITMFTFTTLNIGLNIVFGAIVVYMLINYFYDKKVNKDNQYKSTMNDKVKYVRPNTKIVEKYDDWNNLIFSIQDFYKYNPLAYEEFITGIETFMDMYEETLLNGSVAGQRYEDMKIVQRNVLNSFHSIIHTLPYNANIINKLTNALETIELLLQTYLKKVERIYSLYINKNGYGVSTIIINKGTEPRNAYNDAHYELY
jgi:hypothetical protein